MKSIIAIRPTQFNSIIAICSGILFIAMAFILDFRILLLLGALLIVLGLVFLPSVLVAVMFGGYYLYFLAIEIAGIEPFTNLTAAYLVCLNSLTFFSLFFYGHRIKDPPKMLNFNTGMFIVFLLYIFIQYSLFSYSPGADKKMMFLLIQSVPPFFIGYMLNRQVAIRSFKIAFGLAFFLGAYTIFQALRAPRAIMFTGISYWAYANNICYLSQGAIMVICFCFFQAAFRRLSWKHLLVCVSYLIIFFLDILLAGARGSTLSFVVILIVMLVYFWRKRMLKIKLRIQYIFILILAIALSTTILIKAGGKFSPTILLKRSAQILNIIDYVQGTAEPTNANESVDIRTGLIEKQYKDFTESPIFGIGFGNGWDSYMYVHNIFLEILFETGIIGLLLFIGIFYKCGVESLKIWKRSNRITNSQDNLLTVIIFIWLYFITSGLFGSAFDTPQLWFWTGALLTNSSENQKLKLVRLKIRYEESVLSS